MRNADPKLRSKLDQVREQLKAKRGDRVRLREERDSAASAFGEADFSASGDVKITETQAFIDAEQAVRELGECDDAIANLEVAENSILKMLRSDEPGSGHGKGNGYTPNAGDVGSAGWNGHRLLAESDTYQDAKEAGLFNSRIPFGTVELGQVANRDEFHRFLAINYPTGAAGDVGTTANTVQPDWRGIVPPTLRRLTLLDLLPVGTTDSNIINYVQVTAIPGYAAETAELAAKPSEGLTIVDSTVPVQTVAAYQKIARQALDDTAGLATLINTLLPYDVRRRLEAQILNGNGTGVNLKGILQYTGVGAPASATGDIVPDGILRAMTTIMLADQDPNFVTLNPLSWQSIMIAKASGSGEYMFEQAGYGPAAFMAPTIFGLSVTMNRLISQSQPLVGDRMGATLLIREGVNVRTSDADQDDFIKNRVTVLAETRVALPVWRPSAFAISPLG